MRSKISSIEKRLKRSVKRGEITLVTERPDGLYPMDRETPLTESELQRITDRDGIILIGGEGERDL